MPINGSDLINNPWETIMSPFTDLLGTGVYLIPITMIVVAVYVKTRNLVASSVIMIAAGVLFSSSSIWVGYYEISIVYIIFTALGVTGTIVGIYGMSKW